MNKHLNLFHFFSNNGNLYYENNLSRAFALCLRHDPVFLSRVLQQLLNPEEYNALFNTDYPQTRIEIDLQKELTKWDGLTKVVGVACSGLDMDFEELEEAAARDTSRPITDVSIEINGLGLIFEFKRTEEDCRAQLKRQVQAIPQLDEEGFQVMYVDFSWPKIVALTLNVLSLQKHTGQENTFTRDFKEFLERRHPSWFPNRFLPNIPFSKTDDDPNFSYLHRRLNQIKQQLFGAENYLEVGGRSVIAVNYGWANEVHLNPEKPGEEAFLMLVIYPGDTKQQGYPLYKPDREFDFPDHVQGYSLHTEWYLKFSHFNSGVTWLFLNEQERRLTHNAEFFWRTGRYRQARWPEWIALMNERIPDWKERTDWQRCFEDSNRTYFDVSAGIKLVVRIPYKSAQSIDDQDTPSRLADTLRNIILELKERIDEK